MRRRGGDGGPAGRGSRRERRRCGGGAGWRTWWFGLIGEFENGDFGFDVVLTVW